MVSHPSRKNKNAARVGHPDIWADLSYPPAHRDKAAMNGAQSLKHDEWVTRPNLYFQIYIIDLKGDGPTGLRI
jgi:hypothetical protein